MLRSRKAPITVSILTIILVTSLLTAHQITSGSERIDTQTVWIHDGALTLSGLLHVPREARADNPRPAVVVTHGISGSKEMVDGISLELSRRGIVALSLDLHGHGDSEGSLGAGGPSLGLAAAVQFISSRNFVDPGLIGVAGHSLGAGAARAVALESDIQAVVFIAGGLSGEYPQESMLSSSSPKNLLIAVGSHDVLFRVEDLVQELQPVFGSEGFVKPGVTYGDFLSGDARKLAVRPTTHLLEPMDPGLVAEIVEWFTEALDVHVEGELSPVNHVYLVRETYLLVALASLFGVVLLLPRIVLWEFRGGSSGMNLKNLSWWRALLIWGLSGIILFVPLMGAGSILPFPPQLFGSSMAWWLLSIAVVGVLFLRFQLLPGSLGLGDLIGMVASSFRARDLALSSGLIVALYIAAVVTEGLLSLNFRFFIPVLNSLKPVARLFAFPTYIPFFIAYFVVDGVYMFELRERLGEGFTDLLKALGMKLLPFLAALAVQYVPMFVLNVRVLPVMVGFVVEFVWGVVPILSVTTVASWWLHRVTGRIWAGALFNAFLTAWISASLFPYGSIW